MMRKRDVYGEIHSLLVKNYGHESAGKMFLYMVQKIQGVNYGDSNKILKQELTFLRNSPKRGSKIGAILNID
jgi:hypothetical protein